MKLPKKIEIVESLRSEDSLLRFDDWEGYDTKKQIIHTIHKINEILDYLKLAPEIANEIPMQVKEEGGQVVHEHRWEKITKLGTRLVRVCGDCGVVEERWSGNGQ